MKLYKSADILHTNISPFGGTVIQTPEGIQAYGKELVNMAIIKAGKEQPTEAWVTGYGASYLSKVHTGTPRAEESMLNIYAGSKNGWMIQASYTGTVDKQQAYDMARECVRSLPKEYQKRFKGKTVMIEYGNSPSQLGFVYGSKDRSLETA